MKPKKLLRNISHLSAACLAAHAAVLAIYYSVGQILLIPVVESQRELVSSVFVISLLVNLAVFCLSTQFYRASNGQTKQ